MDNQEEKDLNKKQAGKAKKSKRGWLIFLAIVAALAVILFALYQIPAIKYRASYYISNLKAKIYYAINPPGKSEVDVKAESTMSAEVIATLTALAPTPTLQPTIAEIEEQVATSIPTPTPEPTPIPAAVQLEGIVQEYQRWNSCGPATLALNLRYWGWKGEQLDIEQVVKPRLEDLNVTPQEMVDYIETNTDFEAILRVGGTVDLLKKLIAAGFPVLAERGYVNRDDGWMGHYGVVDGYDDATQEVHIPDTFNGYITLSYDNLQHVWDQFHGTYLVVFPSEDRETVLEILGPDADPAYNLDATLEKFKERAETVDRSEKYFAYYSLGELLVMKKDYVAAAEAFDNAFEVYNWLPVDARPWRMLWYQVGPYEAYYYTGRYQSVISLTFKTLTDRVQPAALPESFLWSGKANVALGNIDTAIGDFKRALEWHPGWQPALDELEALGVKP